MSPTYSRLQTPAFEWGCATSSFQIEGAAHDNGREDSIWDVFCREPGRIKDASNGEVACDHINRMANDVAMIAALGFKHYRFSIAWSRVVHGNGTANQAGLDHYRRLLDLLAQHGITPNATLFHWDLPASLPGAWLNRDTAYRFADYAQLIAKELGDQLPRVATLNEPWCSAFLGYDRGVFAPGHTHRGESLVAAHHLMLAHGLGMQAWRAERSDTLLGVVLNPELCDAASDSLQDQQAARMAELERNDVFLNPLFGREWPIEISAQLQGVTDPRQGGDVAVCAQPLDFIGLNYYTRSVAKTPVGSADVARGYSFVPPTEAMATTDIGWEIYPQGLRRVMDNLLAKWPLPPIWITENGAADNTPVANGVCDDRMRLSYLQQHLAVLDQAVADGLDVRGYYAWSLMDNFEWAEGYTQRFGVVHVDYATQQRTPKSSAKWLQALIAG